MYPRAILIVSQKPAASHLSASTKLSKPPAIKQKIESIVTQSNTPFNKSTTDFIFFYVL